MEASEDGFRRTILAALLAEDAYLKAIRARESTPTQTIPHHELPDLIARLLEDTETFQGTVGGLRIALARIADLTGTSNAEMLLGQNLGVLELGTLGRLSDALNLVAKNLLDKLYFLKELADAVELLHAERSEAAKKA